MLTVPSASPYLQGKEPTQDQPLTLKEEPMNLSQEIEARRRKPLPGPEVRRLLRTTAGLSVEDVAALVEVSTGAVYRWEEGNREPRGENRRRYLEVLRALGAEE